MRVIRASRLSQKQKPVEHGRWNLKERERLEERVGLFRERKLPCRTTRESRSTGNDTTPFRLPPPPGRRSIC
eukprot:497793-Rhodomonas_salina.1